MSGRRHEREQKYRRKYIRNLHIVAERPNLAADPKKAHKRHQLSWVLSLQ